MDQIPCIICSCIVWLSCFWIDSRCIWSMRVSIVVGGRDGCTWGNGPLFWLVDDMMGSAVVWTCCVLDISFLAVAICVWTCWWSFGSVCLVSAWLDLLTANGLLESVVTPSQIFLVSTWNTPPLWWCLWDCAVWVNGLLCSQSEGVGSCVLAMGWLLEPKVGGCENVWWPICRTRCWVFLWTLAVVSGSTYRGGRQHDGMWFGL